MDSWQEGKYFLVTGEFLKGYLQNGTDGRPITSNVFVKLLLASQSLTSK